MIFWGCCFAFSFRIFGFLAWGWSGWSWLYFPVLTPKKHHMWLFAKNSSCSLHWVELVLPCPHFYHFTGSKQSLKRFSSSSLCFHILYLVAQLRAGLKSPFVPFSHLNFFLKHKTPGFVNRHGSGHDKTDANCMGVFLSSLPKKDHGGCNPVSGHQVVRLKTQLIKEYEFSRKEQKAYYRMLSCLGHLERMMCKTPWYQKAN